MKNYEWIYSYLYQHQKGICPISKRNIYVADYFQLHHKIHNTKINKKRFPLLISSIWNLVILNPYAHLKNPGYGKISLLEADKREAFLKRHPVIAAWMNGENYDG